jgi:hypothetical protein
MSDVGDGVRTGRYRPFETPMVAAVGGAAVHDRHGVVDGSIDLFCSPLAQSVRCKIRLDVRGRGGSNAARGVEWKAVNRVHFGSGRERERSSAGRTGAEKAERNAAWRTIEAIGCAGSERLQMARLSWLVLWRG